MEKTKFILFGTGGDTQVIASCIEAMGSQLIGVLDQDSSIKTLDGIKHFGDYDASIHPEAEIILCIGDNLIRERVIASHKIGTVLHPSALIDRIVTIGEGSQVIYGAIINRGTKIGKHCIINIASSIDHDCALNDFIHISPKATLCGNVHIGRGTLIGAGATFLPNVTIWRICSSWCRGSSN